MRECRAFPGTSSARPMCRKAAPIIPSPGTRRCRPAPAVPPHIHPDQDEYLYMLEGKLDFMLAGAEAQATPGDLIRLGMGMPHGIFNKSDQTAKVLFWVSPSQKLYDLFWGLHNMKEQKPEDVVAMAAEYNIHFLPPPPGA